jgi:hypothetical protein
MIPAILLQSIYQRLSWEWMKMFSGELSLYWVGKVLLEDDNGAYCIMKQI